MKKYWPAILLASLVGLLSVFPQVYFIEKLGSDFQGIYREVSNDELYYNVRIQEVIDGHKTIGNPYLWEFKNKPPLQFFIPDYILGTTFKMFGLTTQEGLFFSDLFFPFLITLLIYSIFYLSTKSRFWALTGTIFLVFGIYIDFFNRPISPQITSLPWFIQGILLMLWVTRPDKRKILLVANALCFGVMFYFYTYHSTYFLAFFPIAAVLFFILKKKQEVKDMLIIWGGGIVVGFGYFTHTFQTMQLPEYTDTLARVGMITSHFPSGIIIITYSGIVFLAFLFFWKKKKIEASPKAVLFFSGLIASVVAVNQHVITGKNLEFAGHYIVPATLWATFALVFLLEKVVTKKEVRYGFLGLAIFAGIYTTSLYIQYFMQMKPWELNDVKYGPVMTWLEKNTKIDDVVFAGERTSEFIPSYTHANVFFRKEAGIHFVSDDEIYERFIINHYFENLDEAYIRNRFNVIFGNRYYNIKIRTLQENKVRKIFGLDPLLVPDIPKEALDRVLSKVKELHKVPFEKLLTRYRLDYAVWEKGVDPTWNLEQFKTFTKIKEDANFIIYKHQNL